MSSVTLKDIAREAHVTISTVSAALNGAPGVGDEKRKLIVAKAKAMGYYPNFAAKFLKSHDLKVLGLVISDRIETFSGHGVYSDLIAEMLLECQSESWRPSISLHNPDLEGDGVPPALQEGLFSGCVFCGYLTDSAKAWLRARPEFPFVAFNEPWDYCVRSDSSKGVFNAIQYLLASGHKRISMICGPEKFDIHRQTVEGYMMAAKEFGLPVDENAVQVQDCALPNEQNLPLLDKLFSGSEPPPDALLLSGRKLTSTALYHLARKGVFVPDDLSVISVCSGWEANSLYPEVSTIQFDIRMMASMALKLLSQRLAGTAPQTREIWIEPKLELRRTVRARNSADGGAR